MLSCDPEEEPESLVARKLVSLTNSSVLDLRNWTCLSMTGQDCCYDSSGLTGSDNSDTLANSGSALPPHSLLTLYSTFISSASIFIH